MGEVEALPDDVNRLKALVIERDAAIGERDLEIQQLREYVRLLKSQRFGASSERIHRDQLGLFNEAEQLVDDDVREEDLIKVPSHTRARGGRRRLPSWMPRVEILHDLPEEEEICSHDGEALVEIGRETSEQVEFIPATARVLVHVRPKYGCPRCKRGVRIAPMPPQPIPKSIASASLLAYVAVSKYADALPLYRQQGMLERIGIEVSRVTLAAWMIKLGELVQPLINLMRQELLESGFVQCDESRYQVLKEPGPDNCPFVSNFSQTNSDGLTAGDDCQCGDVTGDGAVTAADVRSAQENLMGITPVLFFAERCNVIGPSDGGVSDCDIADIFILQRFLAGSPVSVADACDAYLGP